MEEWKEILDLYDGSSHKGYFVSNYGNVKTIDRYVISGNRWGKMKKFYKGRDKSKNLKPNGYQTVELSGGISRLIHRLVAFYFLDGYTKTSVVNHMDGIKTNNHYSNLEWCTSSENEKHSYIVLGKQPPNKIITDDIAVIIRYRVSKGEKQNELAKEYGVSKCTINAIIKNRSHRRCL